MEERISMMATLEIHTAEPFNRLFPIKESVLNEIVEDMRVRGYDYGHPVIIWAGHKVTVVDGHTRLAAALKLGMSKIPILLKEFADEDAALQYAIRSQSHRRNLTDAELLTCLGELDKSGRSAGLQRKFPHVREFPGGVRKRPPIYWAFPALKSSVSAPSMTMHRTKSKPR
jgi:ParB-like nuclease domain.